MGHFDELMRRLIDDAAFAEFTRRFPADALRRYDLSDDELRRLERFLLDPPAFEELFGGAPPGV